MSQNIYFQADVGQGAPAGVLPPVQGDIYCTVLSPVLYCTVLYKVASGTWTTNFLRLSGFNQNLPKWQRYSKLHGASEGKSRIELQTKLRDDLTITEMAPTRAY